MAFKLGLYVLQGKLAVPVPDMETWAARFDHKNKHVAETQVGGIWISTVFLGIDHNYYTDGLPILFETVAFRGGNGDDCERCGSWDEAEKQHAEMVERIRREIKEKVNE